MSAYERQRPMKPSRTGDRGRPSIHGCFNSFLLCKSASFFKTEKKTKDRGLKLMQDHCNFHITLMIAINTLMPAVMI